MDWCIEKKTGTYAETLAAVGLASAARELGFPSVRVTDLGGQFQIHSDGEQLGPDLALSVGYPYIWEKSKEPQRPTIPFLDYEDEKQKRDAGRKQGKKAKAVIESQDIETAPEARP